MATKGKIVSFGDAKARSHASSAALRQTSSRSQSTGRGTRADRDARATRAYRAEVSEDRLNRALQTASAVHEERKRARTKARAGKMFTKQFGGSDSQLSSRGGSASTNEDSAPRAALYEGKMGSKHRKSARMQRNTSASMPSAKLNPSGWFASLANITPRTLKVATAALCLVLVCAFLYTPAQQYYLAHRDRDRLAAEYGIIQDRNEALDAQNDILASNAGLEDAVRQKYGYVKQGEETAVVTGLSEEASNANSRNQNIEPAVLSSSVKAPDEWYTPFLDALFGVQ